MWSSLHGRVHLPMKFGADIFIQSAVIEIQDRGGRHLGFSV